ncbi:MAG: TMEM175 family protein [Pseudomonadota bacterium]
MSEPESLATDESIDRHIRRHAYDRLIMVSDGIFAIAITLAALEIKPPEHHAALGAMIHEMTRPIISYLVSFVVIGLFWISHRDLFARIRQVDRVLTILTLAMLCLVALLPAVVHGIYSPGDDEGPFRLYAMAMIGCGLTNAAMWVYAALRPGLMAPEVTSGYRWSKVIGMLALPLLFVPALFITVEQIPLVLLPLAIGLAVLRRVILPRWFGGGR